MREGVDLAPGDLLREEVVAVRLADDLRQGGGVAEHVRNPQVADVHAEVVHEEILAVEELADHRFAGDQIAVGFDPPAALKLPTSFLHAFLDFRKQLRIMIFRHLVELRLRFAEDVVRILLHEGDLAGERTRAFADAFADRPQPADVDVGVADTAGRQRAGDCGAVEHLLREQFADGLRVGGIVVVKVDRLVEEVEKLLAAVVVEAVGVQKFVEAAEIDEHVIDVFVEHAEGHFADVGFKGAHGLRRIDVRRRGLVDAEEAVGGGFDPVVDFRSGLQFAEDETVFVEGVVEMAVACQTIDGAAVLVEHAAFAARVDAEAQRLAGELFRDDGADVEPCALPFVAPQHADGRLRIFQFEPFGERDGILRLREDGFQGDGLRVDVAVFIAEHAVDAQAVDVVDALMHGCRSPFLLW